MDLFSWWGAITLIVVLSGLITLAQGAVERWFRRKRPQLDETDVDS